MKQFKLTFLLTVLMSMVGAKAFAYDIAVANDDGRTIYYNYFNDGKELQVTYYSAIEKEYEGYRYYVYYGGYSNTIIIPEEVNYKGRTRKVTCIGYHAFDGCSGLTSVTIPNSVTYIGSYAFDSCSGLTSITIPNGVTSMGTFAFVGCSGLTSVNITDLEAWLKISFSDSYSNPLSFAGHLFLNGTEIKDLIIPNSVTSIGDYAFSCCSGLTSVTIPNSVTSIGNHAFASCSGLTSVTIPNSVTSIDNSAFYGCSGLTSVTIPNSVMNIGGFAFYGCFGLTSITIPNSVTSIGSSAFYRCNKLFTIVSLIENPFNIIGVSDQYRVFDKDIFYNATLYVPKGTMDKYKSTEGWKDFVWIEEGVPAGIKDIKQETTTVNHYYDLNGQEASQPRKGINIIKTSDGKTKKVVVK